MGERGADRSVKNERVLLEFLLSADPALFTIEVAENLPLSRQRVNTILDELEGDGLVKSKRKSGRRLWWITNKGHAKVAESAREKLA